MARKVTFRPGRAIDAPAIVDILVERQPDTRYQGIAHVDTDYARKMFAQAAFRHGHTNEGGCWLEVAESERGIEAFMLGLLSRVQLVGKKLVAQDALLIGRRDCAPSAMSRLIDGYIGWASSNPRVIDINLSWSDALPTGQRFGAVFKRKGFVLCGENYRRVEQEELRGVA